MRNDGLVERILFAIRRGHKDAPLGQDHRNSAGFAA